MSSFTSDVRAILRRGAERVVLPWVGVAVLSTGHGPPGPKNLSSVSGQSPVALLRSAFFMTRCRFERFEQTAVRVFEINKGKLTEGGIR